MNRFFLKSAADNIVDRVDGNKGEFILIYTGRSDKGRVLKSFIGSTLQVSCTGGRIYYNISTQECFVDKILRGVKL